MLLPWVLADTPHQNEIYDTRQSPQLLVVNHMVDAVQSGDELPLDPCLEPTCEAEYHPFAAATATAGDELVAAPVVEDARR